MDDLLLIEVVIRLGMGRIMDMCKEDLRNNSVLFGEI
jgi:hypothetical protein